MGNALAGKAQRDVARVALRIERFAGDLAHNAGWLRAHGLRSEARDAEALADLMTSLAYHLNPASEV